MLFNKLNVYNGNGSIWASLVDYFVDAGPICVDVQLNKTTTTYRSARMATPPLPWLSVLFKYSYSWNQIETVAA